jgi:hypothetical protein
MAKKRREQLGATVESLRPYVERALRDETFRKDVREALAAARELYGDVSKGNGGIKGAARLATDEKAQERLRKTLEEFGKAGDRLKGKRKKNRRRKALLLAGIIVGALYNPWTGPQTREWLMSRIAGEDELQPLEPLEQAAPESRAPAEPAEVS